MSRRLDLLSPRAARLAGVAAVALALASVAVDWFTWIELDVTPFYGVPLILAALARRRPLLWMLALVLGAMIFAVYAAQIPQGQFALHEPHFVNRVLSAIALLGSSVLFDAWIGATVALASQNEELDRLRALADQANARKTQLLASVSHDIRSPLTTINMIADVIQRASVDPAAAGRVPDMLERLRRTTRALADLVAALVDIAALDAGGLSIHASDFPLGALLAEEHDRLQMHAQSKGLALVLVPHGPDIVLCTDRVKLARVVRNLVGNAIKFTETGTVTVSASVLDGAVEIRVSDTGIGMSAESLEHIFDEYGQLGNSERDSSKGWGLGLAISRRLVEGMGGAIRVESAPGKGTTFTVRLPLRNAA